ncbi:MAG: MmgE/PrpD family protein [Deltaproteobacteria bacterium]|nr:MmgE/PrpD family protein [Deltaproteobacteria bacterium]
MENLEEQLLAHLARVGFGDLPEEVVTTCKLFVMDSLGVTFPGSRAPGCPEVVELARAFGSGQGSTILVYGHRAPPPLAALANSTMMHALDFDDTLDASALHTFVNVLPAALSTADTIGRVNGRMLITALVLGVDVICRLSYGIRRPLSWIRTATCGSFGAAATAGKILGLDHAGLRNALGVVYSQTSGNAQGLVEGRLVKRMQPGFASQAGVTSAFLARAGITGSHRFLLGPYGFYNLYEQGDVDPEPVLQGLGGHYTILDLSMKPYPCCRMTHASIDAALRIRKAMAGRWADVQRVRVEVSKMVTEMVGKPFAMGTDPQVDAQFSIPYTVSVALLRGDPFLEDFELHRIREDAVNALAARVEVIASPALAEKDITHARMSVHLTNGQVHEAEVTAPLGNPANPLDLEQCRDKFRKCLLHSGADASARKARDLLHMVEHLEEVQDVRELLALVRP